MAAWTTKRVGSHPGWVALWIGVLCLGLGCDTADGDELGIFDVDNSVTPADGDGDTGDGDGDTGDGDGDNGGGDNGGGDTATGMASLDQRCATGDCFWSGMVGECKSAGVPTLDMAPDAADPDAGSDLPPIYLGWAKLWLGETKRDQDPHLDEDSNEAWSAFGFDLDSKCTNAPGCETEEQQVSCRHTGLEVPFDGDVCRDNTFARYQPLVAAVPELGDVYGLTEDAMNCSLYHGDYNQIMRLTGYNGGADDPEVRIDYYASPGLATSPDFWECPREGFASMYGMWKPNLPWLVSEEDLTEEISEEGQLPDSRRFTTDAYVRDNYLVALNHSDWELHLPGDNTAFPGWAMTVQEGVMIGKLVQGRDGTWSVRYGLMGGRVRGEDLIASFNQLGLCPDESLGSVFDSVEQYVRDGLDVMADGSIDPDADCDAMSVGIGFEARQLTPGAATAVQEFVNCCEDENMGTASCPVGCGDGRVVGAEKCDIGIAAGEAGACPTSCTAASACEPAMLVGEGCQVECQVMTITAQQDDDECCPETGNAINDNDCPAVCGNGVVEESGGETCDPPGTCATVDTCGGGADVCTTVAITGDPQSCDSACDFSPIESCADDDGCCPGDCDYMNDNDCPDPGNCGNGMLDQGEFCDPPSSCETSCDDGDACTRDSSTGAASTCDFRCINQTISSCEDDDGCCPSSCNANNDSDCGERCGNRIVEGDEECDDGNSERLDGCHECQDETPEGQCLYLIEQDGSTSETCAQCQCANCASEFLACSNGPDANDNALCADVIRCGEEQGCSDTSCFCTDPSGFGCALIGRGDGPCVEQVTAAAGSTNPFDVLEAKDDVGTPLGRASAVGACTDTNCPDECL